MKPLITVVTPSYQNSATIYDTVNSVLNQTYPNIQYIISDDATTDFDCDEIQKYIQSRNRGNIVALSVLKNAQNLGTSKNLNSALAGAEGEYIFNLSADDVFYDENVLEEWVAEFQKTNAQVITASRAAYDAKLKQVLYVAPNKREAELITKCSPFELFDKMSGCNLIFGCCTARTMSNYKLLTGYDEQYPTIEDYPSNMKLLRQGVKIHFWDRIVVKYRTDGISGIGKMNEAYIMQSDNIFQKEILPYVSNKRAARRRYSQWKHETAAMADKARIRNKIGKDKSFVRKILYYIIVIIKHPVSVLRGLKNKLAQR